MSKPRYTWWAYAKGMIRDYPSLKEEHEALRGQSLTASYEGMPSAHGCTSRSVEEALTKGLSGARRREYDAVAKAVAQTERMASGRDRLALIRMVYWDKPPSLLRETALLVPCSEATARRWHGQFLRLVAKNFGMLD